MSDCVFCDLIADGSGPGHRPRVEFLNERGAVEAVVFEPLNPVVPGHVLAVPVEHVAHAADDPEVSALTMRAAARYAQEHYESFNIITSANEAATQTVYHLHLHVVPRRFGDGLKLPWTDQQSSLDHHSEDQS